MLRDDIARYTELTGEDGEHTSIQKIGAYLDGYDDGYEQGKKDYGRPKGEWQITDAYPHNVYCPECHKRYAQTHWPVWNDPEMPLPRNFCPNCGAKMER